MYLTICILNNFLLWIAGNFKCYSDMHPGQIPVNNSFISTDLSVFYFCKSCLLCFVAESQVSLQWSSNVCLCATRQSSYITGRTLVLGLQSSFERKKIINGS